MRKTIIVAGPTASGKSSLAHRIALKFNGEIVNADSIAVYKGFDIGAAKPTPQETAELPYHLFSLFKAHEDCDAGLYSKLARQKISEIQKRSKTPVIVGGTGLYLRALLGQGFHDLPHDPDIRAELTRKSKEELYELLMLNDPDRANELHPNDHFRLARALEIFFITGKKSKDLTQRSLPSSDLNPFLLLLVPPREKLLQNIAARTRQMIRRGLVAEVRGLLENGIEENTKPMQSIGYRETARFILSNSSDWDELEERIIISTRQLARRQVTWFKKMDADLCIENPDFNDPDLNYISDALCSQST